MIFLKQIFRIFLPPTLLLTVHMLYQALMPPNGAWDMIMHFLGGATIAWSAVLTKRFLLATRRVPKDIPQWFWLWFGWGSVAIAGIAWEVFEFLGDVFLGTHMQPSLVDTMGDLMLDMSGGALLLFVALCFPQQMRNK